MMRKPEGRRGASSGNISSIGANTSSEQAPTAFSSIPLQICKRKKLRVQYESFLLLFSFEHTCTSNNNELNSEYVNKLEVQVVKVLIND